MHFVVDATAHGPFDIVGDVHGCHRELCLLLSKLGYRLGLNVATKRCAEDVALVHPDGRSLIFVGDLTDRGPSSASVLEEVYTMAMTGTARCVLGNHDYRLARKLRKHAPKELLDGRAHTHGLAKTLQELSGWPLERVRTQVGWLGLLPNYLVLDDGKLVVAHAGLKEEMLGRMNGDIHAFTLFGQKTDEVDANGFRVLYDWAQDYNGRALVVYGHAHRDKAAFVGNTICLDTRCAFGGELSALRYPEREVVTVKAQAQYYELGKSL